MRTAVYAGSFDPITNGHLDIARRAARIFDRLIVAVYATPSKNLLFGAEERIGLIQEALTDVPNIEVTQFTGLLVNYVQAQGAQVIVKGLRAISDFEMEFQQALMNNKLAPDVEFICLMTNREHMFLSSSIVKEVAKLGGDLTGLVAPNVAVALRRAYGLTTE